MNKGKRAEKIVKTLFDRGGFHVERLHDTHDSLIVTATTSDFVVAGSHVAAFVEVKSTIKDRFYKTDLSEDQIRRQVAAAKKGTDGYYVFVYERCKRLDVFAWEHVFEWYTTKHMRGILHRFHMPLVTLDPIFEKLHCLDLLEIHKRKQKLRMADVVELTVETNRNKYKKYKI